MPFGTTGGAERSVVPLPIELYRYRRVGDLQRALAELPPCQRERRTFLAPGRGDRELLKEFLWSPKSWNSRGYSVMGWDELYRWLALELGEREAKLQIDPPDHWLILLELLRRFDQEHPGALPPGARQGHGFVALLGDQIRELLGEEISPQALQQCCHGELGSQALCWIYQKYQQALEELHLADSAAIATEARILAGRPQARELCSGLELLLVGCYSLTHSQLELLRSLNRAGTHIQAYVPSVDVEGEYSLEQQLELKPQWISKKRPFKVLRFHSGDGRQEMETLARSLLLWEQGQGPLSGRGDWPGWRKIAISVPSRNLAKAQEAFDRYGLPWILRTGAKVTDTALWRLASQCLEAASESWPGAATLRLLAEPWMGGLALSSPLLRGGLPQGERAWRAALTGDFLESFDSATAFAAKVQQGGTALELLEALKNFLRGRPQAAAGAVLESPQLDGQIWAFSQAMEYLDRKILEHRETVRDLKGYGSQALTGSAGAAFLRAWCEGASLQAPMALSESLWVFVDAPPALFSRPLWFLTGVTAKAWPGGLSESPLLGEAQKERLHQDSSLDPTHLPLLSEQRKQREILFRRLIACGEDMTVLSCPLADDEGRPLEETAFIASAAASGWIDAAEPESRRTGDFLVPWDQPRLRPPESRQPLEGEAFPERRLFPQRLDLELTSLGYSELDHFDQCPYRFALINGLKYQEPPREGQLDPLKQGTAVHGLWKMVWEAYSARGFVGDLVLLSRRFREEALEREYPELLHSPAMGRHRLNLWHLLDLCAGRQKELEETLRPRRDAVECEGTLPSCTLGPVTFKGRFDRLDRLKDGRVLLWDYKAGSAPSYGPKKQLAAYALALSEAGTSVGGFGYLTMADGGCTGAWEEDLTQALCKEAARSKASLEDRIEEARDLRIQIAQAAESGRYLPNYKSDSCRFCGFAKLCRKGELGDNEDLWESWDDQENPK